MSVSTWDAVSASSYSVARQRQRRRTVAQPISSRRPAQEMQAVPISVPHEDRPRATLREHAGIVLLGVAVAALHTMVASQWESAASVQPPAPQVVVELVKPREIEPPKPPEPVKPPKPQPQKLAPPPKAIARPAPQPQPAPAPLAQQPEPAPANTTPAVTVPPAAPVQAPAPAPQETVTPASASAAYLHNPPPAYPASAQRLGLEGKVVLRVRVLASGKPVSVELQSSSGRKMLDEAAIAAVQGWMFAPARRGQTPIEGWATVPVEFKLERS
jgi:protein TonB